ncbi:hypothetical protein [Spirosoma oryzicola]|uniref:hypothetical protein n=1 Tax=Spirosoma oryzicola TaxID=2898794 RepID=UPI001E5B29B2|nr:hypothetical protein [Spirosoma oryzicola]UHG93391.1 hypothetical protein LQ777_10910 [Spirosoma oryzicola]
MSGTLRNIDTDTLGGIALALLIAVGIGFLIYHLVDCAQGTDIETSGQLVDKYHSPAWDEHRTVVVQDGKYSHLKIETTHHPERFVLSIYDGDGGRDIDVERAVWLHYKTGDWVKLRKRYGKRSKCKCYETVL